MIRVDSLLGLGVNAFDVRSHHIAHDVQIVGSEIDDNADVADSRRERSLTAGVDLEDPPQLSRGDAPPKLTHCWIEPLDVADG